MKRDEGGELRLPEELENGSFDDVAAVLADGSITRARAIKLAGAALLAGSGMMALFQSPAEARKKRRRRRKKKVTASPREVTFPDTPAGSTSESKSVTVTNNGTEPVSLQLVGDGFQFGVLPGFNPSAPILPGTSATVPIVFSPSATADPDTEYSGTLVAADTSGHEATVALNGSTPPA